MSTRALPRATLAAVVLVQLVASVLVLTRAPAGAGVAPAAPAPHAAPAGTVATTGQPPSAQAALTPPPNDGGRRVAVQQLLDRWASAVRARDDAALAALFDPGADPGFLGREKARATNLTQVPLADWGYGITTDPSPTVPPTVQARMDADEVWSPPVALHYAIAGADPAPTTRPVGLVVARRGSRWQLVSDSAEDDYGRLTWRGPWDFGPVIARTVQGGVILAHPGHAGDADTLAAELTPAVDAVIDFWGPVWQQRVAVVLPDTQVELKALVGNEFADAEIAAVAIADDIDRTQHVAMGQRVVFNPATIGKLTALSRRVVLRHELTHVAARAVTAPQVPVWLAEGFADYSGYRGSGVSLANGAPAVAALVRTAGPPDSLPTDVQFGGPSTPAQVELAYQLAWTFAVFLATVKGESTLRAVYLTVAALPAPTVADIDRALQPVVGEDLAVLVQEWGRWLQTTLR